MMGFYDLGYGLMGFGWIFLILALFFGAIIWLVIWLVNKTRKPDRYSSSEKSLEILKERYAKGTISKKEYIEMKKELSKE